MDDSISSGHRLFKEMARRRRDVKLERLVQYAGSVQATDKPCSCGSHKAIVMYAADGAACGELCPRLFWLVRAKLAMRKGELTKWLAGNSLEQFLSRL